MVLNLNSQPLSLVLMARKFKLGLVCLLFRFREAAVRGEQQVEAGGAGVPGDAVSAARRHRARRDAPHHAQDRRQGHLQVRLRLRTQGGWVSRRKCPLLDSPNFGALVNEL